MHDEEKAKKIRHTGKLILENAFRFAVNLIFIGVFQLLFGADSILPGVAIGVAFTMFPTMPVGIKPRTFAGIIVGLFTLCGISGQSALLPWWAAAVINFMTVIIMFSMISEPLEMKPYIAFILCFVFAQAAPVPWGRFPMRLAGCFFGGLFVALSTLLAWKKIGLGYEGSGRTLKEQVQISILHRGYILRMAFGITAAMLIGMLLHLSKPLWISIVVMSLTQPEIQDTLERIKHRTIGTLIGTVLFFLLFVYLIPHKFAMAAILFIGYISFFMPEYKHKQAVNAINALNASLVLLDTTTAVENRLLCLAGGILIVLSMWGIHLLLKRYYRPAAAQRCPEA